MELWIRSQDKEKMLKVDELSLIGMGGHKVAIGTFTKKLKNDDYCNYLGTYKDKKRALEILDEIHNILQPRVYIEQPDIELKPDELIMNLSQYVIMHVNDKVEFELKNIGQIVYQMPKE